MGGSLKVVPLRLSDVTRSVALNTEQVAKICGVSRRQYTYWLRSGILPDGGANTLEAIEKILLLKRQLEAGGNLRQAIRRVTRTEPSRQLFVDFGFADRQPGTPVGVLDLLERLALRLRDAARQQAGADGLRMLLAQLDAIELDIFAEATLHSRAEVMKQVKLTINIFHRLLYELTPSGSSS